MKAISIFAVTFVALLLFGPHSMRAQQSAAAASGSIQGTVTKAGTNDPLAGAKVSLAGGPGGAQVMRNLLAFAAAQGLVIPNPPPGTSDEQIMQSFLDAAVAKGVPISLADIQSVLDRVGGATLPTTTTDSSGRFTFANVPVGRYTVRVERNGYFGTSINGPNPMSLLNTTVVAGQIASVAMSMNPTAIISGHVRDSAGRPVSNVDVQAYRVFYQGGMPLIDPVISKPTDDLGEYRLIWVLPGEYYVAVTPRPPSSAAIVSRSPQDVTTYFPAAMDPSAAIPVTVRAGEEASAIDIGVRRVRPFHITGRVNSSVTPPPISPDAQGVFALINQQENNTASLYILPRSATVADHVELNSMATVVLNASSGQFDIPNILPGFYDLYARVNDQNAPAFGHVEVDVINQDVTGLVVNVRSSVNVAGSVTIGTSDRSVPPTESWRVTLEPSGSLAKLGFGLRRGPVGARISPISREGGYNIQGVPPGHYRLNVTGLPVGLYVDSVRQSETNVFDSGFDVGIEPPTPLQIAVKPGAGSVEGTARNSEQKLMPGAVVALVPTGRRENLSLYRGASADATGAFTIRGVAPGEYKMFAWETTPPGAYYNADFLKKYEDSGRVITIAVDSKLHTDITVIP